MDSRLKSTVALAGLVAINQPLFAEGEVMTFFAWHFKELDTGHGSCYALCVWWVEDTRVGC